MKVEYSIELKENISTLSKNRTMTTATTMATATATTTSEPLKRPNGGMDRRCSAVKMNDSSVSLQQDGVHDHDDDDDDKTRLNNVDRAVVTPSFVVPPHDNSSAAALSTEAHLPIAQSLEDNALEKEVLDRALS
jgi:hypothetical protein